MSRDAALKSQMGPYARSRDGMRARNGSGAGSLARKGEDPGSQKFLKATRGRAGGRAGPLL